MNDAKARVEPSDTPSQASEVKTSDDTPPQASPETKDVGPHLISPTQEYQFGEGDDAFSVSGLEVRNLVGRGALASRLQSQADVATARNGELETALTGSQEELAELKQSLAQIEQRDQIAKSIREQIPAASRQAPLAGGDDWSTGEDGVAQPPAIDPDKIAQQIGDIAHQTVQEAAQQTEGNMEELVANTVARIMKEQNTQRDTQENARQWASDRLEQRVERYVTKLGFSEQEATSIAKLFDTAQLHENLGSQAASQSDGKLAADHYDEATRLTTAGNEQIAGQMVKHEEQQRITELEAQVESGQFSGLPAQVDDSVDLAKPNKFWKLEGRRDFKNFRESLKNAATSRMEKMNLAQQALSAERERVSTR